MYLRMKLRFVLDFDNELRFKSRNNHYWSIVNISKIIIGFPIGYSMSIDPSVLVFIGGSFSLFFRRIGKCELPEHEARSGISLICLTQIQRKAAKYLLFQKAISSKYLVLYKCTNMQMYAL